MNLPDEAESLTYVQDTPPSLKPQTGGEISVAKSKGFIVMTVNGVQTVLTRKSARELGSLLHKLAL